MTKPGRSQHIAFVVRGTMTDVLVECRRRGVKFLDAKKAAHDPVWAVKAMDKEDTEAKEA